jgi:hypothetical protein
MRSTIVALVFAAGLLSGQAPKAQRQDILNYQLNLPLANRLITAMEAMTKYVVSLPDFQARVVKQMKMSPAEQIADLEKDPKAMAIVKQNGLTAAEYAVGVPALRMALGVASGGPRSPNFYASPANVAFAKANLAQLKPKMDAADGMPAAKKK